MELRRGASAVFGPLRHAPAYRALSESIESKILGGELAPGDPLPTEQELAESFGVNRSTVREAIRLLEQEGLLVRAAGRRLQVALPGLGDLAPRAMRALVLEAVSFRELWEVGMTLEPRAARLAAEHATADDVAALDENLERTGRVMDSGKSYVELDSQFHAIVARAAGNRVLMLAREPVSLLLAPTLEQLRRRLPQAGERNLEAHRRIVDAIRRSDPDSAEEWTRKHFVDFWRGYQVAQLDMDAAVDWPSR